MYILGISSYAHEASCALLHNGQIKFLIEEERLNREKHTWKFPSSAIRACLAQEGITFDDIDHITFFWKPSLEVLGNVGHFFRYFPHTLHLFDSTSGGDTLSFLKRVFLMQTIGNRLKKDFGLSKIPKVHFIEHHLCHAASTFFVSPFEEAAILTFDGRGEETTCLMAVGSGSNIRKIKEIQVPHSLGHMYAAITDYLGFRPFFDEWKVMGMSAYGKNTFAKTFEDMITLTSDGGFRLNLKYFKFHTHGQKVWVSDHFIKELGPRRLYKDGYDQRHYDIAYGLQKVIEKTGIHMAQHLYKVTQLKNLCMTGGVALNCLMNKRIVEETPFKDFFIQPIASDAGTSMGSALYFYHQNLKKERNYLFDSAYLGQEFANDQIEPLLKKYQVHYKKCDDIAKETASFVAQGKIVGWFQGRMEAGPRALGNRSIIVNPTDPSMKDRLNSRVKKREGFRPFAPSVLEERVFDYFEMPKGQFSPYMILIGDVKKDKKSVIPSVTHADGTARVHTVNKNVNPRFWHLINEFEKITGVPVVLNTSFNENEPIVCTPKDAIECFLRTEFDVLAIGDYLVVKNGNGASAS